MKGLKVTTIKKQRDELADVRDQLNAWGAWLRAASGVNLNLSTHANFVVVMGGKDFDYDDEGAEVIEEILVHMKREIPLVFKVIQQDYYFNNSTREGADRLKISHSRYRDAKSSGETFVHAYLLAERNFNLFKISA